VVAAGDNPISSAGKKAVHEPEPLHLDDGYLA